MTALQRALDRKPPDLGPKHVEIARTILGRRDGITRADVEARLGRMNDRTFRDLVADIVRSSWLPIIADRGPAGNETGRYRIARVDEADAMRREVAEHESRARKSHQRAKGLTEAFRNYHSAGSLFAPDVPELEEVI